MEFRVSNRLTGARQPTGSPEKKGRPEKGASLGAQCRIDKLALSRQAVAILEERTRQEAQERARKQRDRMAGREESASSPLDAAAKKLKVMRQCQKIAARIMAGDKVPPEDERYLMENDPESYKLAIAMRKPKEDPKEYDSVLEDEDREGGGESTGAMEAESPEAE